MNPNEPHFEAVETKREQIERDLRPFSDDDLLMELRRRNVLGRVDYHTITPWPLCRRWLSVDVTVP